MNQIRTEMKIELSTVEDLVKAFHRPYGRTCAFRKKVIDRLAELIVTVEFSTTTTKEELDNIFWGEVRRKFDFERSNIKSFLGVCAQSNIFFNYNEKLTVEEAFCFGSKEAIVRLKERVPEPIWQEAFKPSSQETIKEKFASELKCATATRKDSVAKDRSDEILEALFSAFCFKLIGSEKIRSFHTNGMSRPGESYNEYLAEKYGELFDNNQSLIVLDCEIQDGSNIENEVEYLSQFISDNYKHINNHGYVSLIVRSSGTEAKNKSWLLASRLTLFADKFLPMELKGKFYEPSSVAEVTCKHIGVRDVDFSTVYWGLFYRDCFVCESGSDQTMVLIFQKNHPDDRVLPCPACWSETVRGNSYSSLGVRAWECKEVICLDKSKFNRGKRYSFDQFVKQSTIGCKQNEIDKALVKKWQRDVQPSTTIAEVFEMLILFFSSVGDGVATNLTKSERSDDQGRRVSSLEVIPDPSRACYNSMISSGFFDRFRFNRTLATYPSNQTVPSRNSNTLIKGDCVDVLKSLESDVFDGAVTSPPYFNAREYSQWPNIYTYLHDMQESAFEVHRTLKSGAFYLFNIFNYFDNENIITSSAMGNRRLILAEYVVSLFEEIGFKLYGNVVWDKGHIEGKRSFNQGNNFPRYQAPHNCWEHILIFQKQGGQGHSLKFPSVLTASPVKKMFNGENRHGHTAPYPIEVPNLLCSQLEPGSLVLDPYSGSMTTGISAIKQQCIAFMIERDSSYYRLGKSQIDAEMAQPSFMV